MEAETRDSACFVTLERIMITDLQQCFYQRIF